MGAVFGALGVQVINWPEGVPFPPVQSRPTVTTKSKSAKTKGKENAKGKSKLKSKPKPKPRAKGKGKGKAKDEDEHDYDEDEDENEEEYEDIDDDEDVEEGDTKEDEVKPPRVPKSVGNLPLSSLIVLGSALCDEHYPLCFKVYNEGPETGKMTDKPLRQRFDRVCT